MGGKEDVISEIRGFKRTISSKHRIDTMLLFGSAARGEMEKDSDIDLILVSPEFRDMRPLKRPVSLYMEWSLPYPVDFICYTPEEFEELKNRPGLVREALKEGIII